MLKSLMVTLGLFLIGCSTQNDEEYEFSEDLINVIEAMEEPGPEVETKKTGDFRDFWRNLSEFIDDYLERRSDRPGYDTETKSYCIDYYKPEPYCTKWLWNDVWNELDCSRWVYPEGVCLERRYNR